MSMTDPIAAAERTLAEQEYRIDTLRQENMILRSDLAEARSGIPGAIADMIRKHRPSDLYILLLLVGTVLLQIIQAVGHAH